MPAMKNTMIKILVEVEKKVRSSLKVARGKAEIIITITYIKEGVVAAQIATMTQVVDSRVDQGELIKLMRHQTWKKIGIVKKRRMIIFDINIMCS